MGDVVKFNPKGNPLTGFIPEEDEGHPNWPVSFRKACAEARRELSGLVDHARKGAPPHNSAEPIFDDRGPDVA